MMFYPHTCPKSQYFIDNVHFNDKGMDLVAHSFAHNILRRDFPEKDWTPLERKKLFLQ